MILYRTAGPWGSGVGANLAADQVDGNFWDLHTRIQYVELNSPKPVQISSINSVGNQLYIYMSDGFVHGPVTMPVVRWRFLGDWRPVFFYAVDDVVIGPDAVIYIVTWNHTSGGTFDSGASDGLGHNLYTLLLRVPGNVIPVGGSPGYALTKITGANYDMGWMPTGVPPGGSVGTVLQKNTSTSGDASWNTLVLDDIGDLNLSSTPAEGDVISWSVSGDSWVNRQPPTLRVLRATSWAPVIGDGGSFMVLTNGSVNTTITVPADATQNFPIGTELHIHQDGMGAVTVVGESPVIMRRYAGFTNVLLGQYATATVKKTASNEWRLFGLLTPA